MSQRSSFARPSQRNLALGSMMNAPPPLIEADSNSACISLATLSPGLTDFSDLHTAGQFTRSSNPYTVAVRPPGQQQTPLVDWSSHVAPWNPIQGRVRNDIGAGGKLNQRLNGASFFEYRSPYYPPSESENTAPGQLPSDSGYGSLTRQSVAEGSLFGDLDRSGDTASVSSHLAGIHFDRPPVSTSETWTHQAAGHCENFVSLETNGLVCAHCKESVKTKSELKKHHQKHTKPYHCTVPGCSRQEGFSTPNDVDRHTRSCHPEKVTKGKSYQCTVANCRSKDKKWPRADNFRQHLKRVHLLKPEDDDLEKYVYRSPVSPGSDLAGLGTSVGAGLVSSNVGTHGLGPDSWAFGTQSTQEQTPRDHCELSDYMDREMEFRQAIIAQEHFTMVSRAEHNVSENQVETASLDLNEDSSLTSTHTQPQGLQGFATSSIDEQETEFDEPSFFNEASRSDDEPEDDEQSVICHAPESNKILADNVDEEPQTLRQTMIESVAVPSTGSEYQADSHDITAVDDDDALDGKASSPMSTSPASSSADRDELIQSSTDAIACAQNQATYTLLDVSDVIRNQDKAFDFIKALKEQGLLTELLEKVHYETPKDTDTTYKADTSVRRDVSKNTYVCSMPDCAKTFPRNCELKKHMKRHVKPYGCTFPKCAKRFGSKNDWKRHENSQHYQLESWKCNEQSRDIIGELCNRPYSRREQFKAHLSKDHGIADVEHVDQKLETCLDVRNFEVRFWCGFCQEVVRVKETGLKAWLGRFDHIDSHYSSQMDIADWKSPDAGLPEVNVFFTGSSEASHGVSQNIAASPSAGAESGRRLLKRGANDEAQQSRPQKKARPNAVWYCCGCGNQSLTDFSTACLTSDCGGHEQCESCTIDFIPLE